MSEARPTQPWPTDIELERLVTYHTPTSAAIERHDTIRASTLEHLKTIRDAVPPGRERDIAMQRIEEAMFMANAGIARNHDRL